MSDDWQVVEEALVGYICPADEPNPWEAIARLREREAQNARKVEAYDNARATVKIEGNTRAYYVLRTEAAEARVARLEGLLLQCASTLQPTHPEMAKRLRALAHEEEA